MHKKDLVSIIVVDWRSNSLTKNCLNSIYNQSYKNFEVILVENEPEEDFLEGLKRLFPSLIILINKKNLFYSSSQNQGIKSSKGEFILCLNNDIILDKDYLKEAIGAIKIDKRIGIVAGKILSYDGHFIDSCGQILSSSRKPVERFFSKKNLGECNSPEFIFGACGACAFYRREMLEEIKLDFEEYFDREYGLFYEDLDLNWRANLYGWKTYYNPKAVAYHLRGSSVKLHKPRLNFFRKFEFCNLLPEHKLMLLRNRYATIIKNDSLKVFSKNFFFIFLYDFFLWTYLFFFEPLSILKFGKEIKFLFKAYKKRREVKKYVRNFNFFSYLFISLFFLFGYSLGKFNQQLGY